MEKDSRQVLEQADLGWFVTVELREEYRRRVLGLALDRCRILPPISGAHVFLEICWRPEFAEVTTVAFTGALKSSCHDVFEALMAGMRRSGGRLIMALQKNRLAALQTDMADWEDVISIRPLHPDPTQGLKWVAKNSSCLLVHYSFEEEAEPLSKTIYASKFQEYSHMGLPILVVAPAEIHVGSWAVSRRWPLYLDTLDAERILLTLQKFKDTRVLGNVCTTQS